MVFSGGIVLVHHISGARIKVDASKVEVVSKISVPTTQRNVRSFFLVVQRIIEDS